MFIFSLSLLVTPKYRKKNINCDFCEIVKLRARPGEAVPRLGFFAKSCECIAKLHNRNKNSERSERHMNSS